MTVRDTIAPEADPPDEAPAPPPAVRHPLLITAGLVTTVLLLLLAGSALSVWTCRLLERWLGLPAPLLLAAFLVLVLVVALVLIATRLTTALREAAEEVTYAGWRDIVLDAAADEPRRRRPRRR
ncbi:MAG TPA: hypothetical protein VGQ83_07620 [Polyangia bacterium]|jgi:hypothetical protein